MYDVQTFGTGIRKRLGELVTGLEFMNDTVLDMAISHIPELTFPLETRSNAYLLVELSSSVQDLDLATIMENVFAAEFERGSVVDGVVAQSETQRKSLWKLREELPEGQRRDGPQAKHDISVPVSRIAEFIDISGRDAHAILPGSRICAFGHLGDGNIHFNYSPPAGAPSLTINPELSTAVYDRVSEFGGSFAAEHGLGFRKPPLANARRSAVEREIMRDLRTLFNPDNFLNPGVSID